MEAISERRRSRYMAFCRAAYGDRFRTTQLHRIARALGVNVSTKTLASAVRDHGKQLLQSSQWKRRVGMAKRFEDGRYLWKTSGLSGGYLRVALAFNAWSSYADEGGEIDFEAIMRGEKPP